MTPTRTRTRATRVVETDEFISFARRILTAMSKRVSNDSHYLPELAALAEDIEQATLQAVAGARAQGYSWADIGATLGTSKQAAQQRYGHRIAATTTEVTA